MLVGILRFEIVHATFIHANVFPSDPKIQWLKSWDLSFVNITFRTNVQVVLILCGACSTVNDSCGTFVQIHIQ